MKKILSLLMVLCMVFGIALPALATEPQELPTENIPNADNQPYADDIGPLDDTQTGKLILNVQDSTNTPIVGAVYTVGESNSGTIMDTMTTGSNGQAVSTALPLGNYTVKEKSMPSGYSPKSYIQSFSLVEPGEVSTFDIQYDTYDIFTQPIRVKKTDDADNPLQGVVFGVFEDGVKVQEITTGADGIALTDPLPESKYTVKELQGLSGYEMDATEKIVYINNDLIDIQTVPFVNPRIPEITGILTVYKTDDSYQPLKGAVFGIFQGNEKIQEMTSGSDGMAVSRELPEGDYTLRELEAPKGYLITTQDIDFGIHQGNVEPRFDLQNTRIAGKLKIIKTGTDKKPLAGVIYGVYDKSTDKKLEELTTGADGTATSGTLYYGEYYIKELKPAAGYEPVPSPVPFGIVEHNVTVEIRLTADMIQGSVKIIKIDEGSGQRLKDAVFGLYNDLNQKIAELKTNANGEAIYSGLPAGDYTLKEQQAPEMYILLDVAEGFSIVEQGRTVEKTIANKKGFATLSITKTGEGANTPKLGGVEFEIYRKSTGEKVSTVTTDTDGKANVLLPLGTYELKETKTAEGYLLLEKSVEVVLKENGSTIPLVIENKIAPVVYGYIKLTKTDESDSVKKLQGAVFGVYKDDGSNTKVTELTTGSDGIVTSQALPVGKYYLMEQAAPTGYTLDNTKRAIIVDKDKTVEVTLTNKQLPADKGVLQIIKTDKDNRLLQGAVFTVLDAENKKMGDLGTGNEGMAAIELPAGKYTVQETKAPDGYQLDETKREITITAGKTESLTVVNKKKVENLQIVKSSAGSGEKLEGAVFGVYKEGTTDKLAELTTDKDGLVGMELAPGDYFLLELQAPTGYVAEKAKISFIIKSLDEVVKVEVTNVKASDLPVSEKPNTDTNGGSNVSIPQTGQAFPVLHFTLGSIALIMSIAFGYFAVRLRKKMA